jgi:lipoprotein-anchoring transpeptidase ErfK/SrfK
MTMYAQPQPIAQPNVPSRRHRQHGRRVPWLLVAGVLAVITALLMGMVGLVALVFYSPGDRIPSGVTVAGIPIGGQSVQNATDTLQRQNLAGQPLLLTDGDRSWTLTLADLGVGVNIPATIQAAREANSGASVQPWYTIDLNQAQNALVALSAQVNIAAVPGNPPKMGRAIDIPVVLSRLYENLSGEVADGVLELSMIEVTPPEVQPSANRSTGATTVHVVEQGQELGLIARLYGVSMQDIVAMNGLDNPDLLYVGQQLTIPAAGIYEPTAADAPAAPTNAGKSIVVSTEEQRIYAYENGQLVHSYLVSTGLPDSPTVHGDFQVYVKYLKTDMSGPGYYLPDVPYTMYFYQGYGIHGTYWHNSFGRPMSHGCVNLPTDQAQWFYNWAEVGTPVRVI